MSEKWGYCMKATIEKAFEAYIQDTMAERGWIVGTNALWDKKQALFPSYLLAFIKETQPDLWQQMELLHKTELPAKLTEAFIKERDSKGTLHVIRHGFKFYGKNFKLAYFKPAHALVPEASDLFEKNTLHVTRQAPCHPHDNSTVDMVLSLNGVPVATMEVKNPATGQNWKHAIAQYQNDRDPRAPLFLFKKGAVVHFAVDPDEVRMATQLNGGKTFFLPFNRGSNPGEIICGKGNPQHPSGHRTGYFWEDVLNRESFLEIVGSFIFLEVAESIVDDGAGGRKKIAKETMIFPRFHQLDAVRKLIDHSRSEKVGHNYLNSMLHNCHLCPRHCGADRIAGETGFCRAGALPRVALAALHHWEEPCISGSRGSGTVFFSRCNLACVFCQNHDISQDNQGTDISVDRLAAIFMEQQARGAHNLNLVTPTPHVPQIIEALSLARRSGFDLPVVYNTSAYETVETIESLQGWADVYLPDLKYCNDILATRFSNAPGYFEHASLAIQAMIDQTGPCVFDAEGLLRRGVLIRHLALPGQSADSRQIIAAIRERFGQEVWFSLMNQYTPQPGTEAFPELQGRLTDSEYDNLIEYALSLGLENGFIQEPGTASKQFIPTFNLKGVARKEESP